ncbi:YggS family pyridoxal phosphate-dependent enzyme [Ornithinimicrobium pratense]|uniref:Pyridoxal phosphate homeostasis protein n=1 Tax=Ornithinimicrobium pratense TaxID=2593973 RepID=A0A5J6V345_9MICO|nr:YggS family pyridoxal phosphate-dependent enzyme [Ornithinimicrobium pratense]QFG68145.1 YggS family pyridoxal phosphate-dependent enzyme [Ornithinimicrobium pratense]
MGEAGMRHTEIKERLTVVRARIERACEQAGRDPDEITLIAVTKFFPASDIAHLLELGVRDIGENKDQEAGAKVEELEEAVRERLTVHFVGQLQSNKAGRVARYADMVQSLDRSKIVAALDRGRATAREEGHAAAPLEVLVQVDLGEGEQAGRGGVLPEQVPALAEAVAGAEHLRLRGLMAVAPFGLDETGTRAAFDRLAHLGEDVRHTYPQADLLSAGMSADLELAIASGATHLRVGSAILGSRQPGR